MRATQIAMMTAVLTTSAWAAPPSSTAPSSPAPKRAAPTTPKTTATPATATATTTTATTATTPTTLSAKEALAQAQKLYDSLEYDKVAPLAAQALADPAISLDDKLVAYQLQGSALAIIGDPSTAERPFLLLLTVRPGFTLSDDTPPKIKAVFAKVKGEFDEVRKADEARLRKELAATIELRGAPPPSTVGGRPYRVELSISDPRGVVRTVRMQYRKRGAVSGEYLSLPLAKDARGTWVGAVPGEWTANDGGFVMDVVVVAADAQGPLQQIGTDDAPIAVTVAAGQVDKTARPVPLWVFGTSAAVTGAALLTSTSLAGVTAWQNADYHQKLDNSSAEDPVDGSDIVEQANLGASLNTAQVVGWSVTGVSALLTGVLALFTNFTGDVDEETTPTPTPTATPTATGAAK